MRVLDYAFTTSTNIREKENFFLVVVCAGTRDDGLARDPRRLALIVETLLLQ